MKIILILILLLFGVVLQSSYAQLLENELIISISADGEARVSETLNTPTTISSINAKLVSNEISHLLAIDEDNIFLTNSQNGNDIRIDSLGASHVTLSYTADIVKNDLGIWRVDYDGNLQSTIILPALSNILSVNNIPLSIVDNVITMPPGQISLSYTIRDVTTQNFQASSVGSFHTVQIMTGSQVNSFSYDSGIISFSVDYDAPILVIIPNSLSSGPFEILLNEKLIDDQSYFQDGNNSWIRITPQSNGEIKIMEKTIIGEIPPSSKGGGCLIATATFGSELAPQVQQLRELRDNSLLQTKSGTSFMNYFNNVYYSFSPIVADYERENPFFKEAVKLTIIPMVSSLSILNYVDMDSENSVLGYGISLILLNIGIYFGIPASIIIGIKKNF